MFLQGNLPSLLDGAVLTLEVAGLSLVVSVVLGFIGAMCKLSSSKPLVWLAELYSTVIRGVPDLVWMFMLFFGGQMLINDIVTRLGAPPVDINPFLAGVLTIGFIFGAYMTETFRGAIMAVPKGQMEAGLAYGMAPLRVFFRITLPQMVRFTLNTSAYTTEIIAGQIRNTHYGEIEAAKAVGMSKWLMLRRIVVPSALRRALPAYSNEVIMMMQGTSIAGLVTLADLTGVAHNIYSHTYQPFEPFLMAAAIYLALTFLFVWLFKLAERRWLAYLAPRKH